MKEEWTAKKTKIPYLFVAPEAFQAQKGQSL